MTTDDDFISGTANLVYNALVKIPFSLARGLIGPHCLPSSINYWYQNNKAGFMKRTPDPEGAAAGLAQLVVDHEIMDAYPDKKRLFESHYYGKLQQAEEAILRGGDFVRELTEIPHHSLKWFSGIVVMWGYSQAFERYGTKALIPLAITTALSLAHELRFNRKIGNLEKQLEV